MKGPAPAAKDNGNVAAQKAVIANKPPRSSRPPVGNNSFGVKYVTK